MQTILDIGGKAVRLDHYEPKSPGPSPAILLLHGAGGNTNFWLEGLIPLIAPAGIAVYAVHYFDRTATVRADLHTLTDGIHVPLWISTIRETLAHIAALPSVDSSRIALVGVSLGAFLSVAVAVQPGTPPIRAIVDVSGGLVPPYDAGITSAFPPTLILHGDADTVVSIALNRTLEAALTQHRVPHEFHVFPGEGHWFSEPTQARILAHTADFMARKL
jgi:carboxymethylenebutenolidase